MIKDREYQKIEFKHKIYATIYWTSLALILLWYILKSIGIIQTPLWIELLPFAIAVFGAGAFIQRICNSIVNLQKDLIILKTDFLTLNGRVGHLESDMHYIKAKL